jgi:glycerate dehydrogenase
MPIVVLDGHTLNPGDNPWDPVSRLGELVVYDRTPPRSVVERARGAEILLTNKTALRRDVIEALPDLRFIAVMATGYNVVDVAAARQRHIVVSNVPEYGTESVAQHTFALLLELTNQVALHAAAVSAGEWSRSADFSFWKKPLVELSGRMLAVVGRGRIGRRVAEIARAFGMDVAMAGSRLADRASLVETVSRADVVTLHCALHEENARLVDGALLRRMKPTAFLVNTARGALVDEAALAEALAAGTIAGAALDVAATEPLDRASPLVRAPNLFVTPHLAWASLAARRRLMETTAKNVAAVLAGTPINVVG